MSTKTLKNRLAVYATEFSDQSEGEELVIPENLSELSADELSELSASANEAFDALYDGGNASLSDEDLATLSALAEGIEALSAETESRAEAERERAEQAAQLAARVGRGDEGDDDEAEDGEEVEEETEGSDDEDVDENAGEEGEGDGEGDEPQPVTASAGTRRTTRIPMSSVRSRGNVTPTPAPEAPGVSTVLFSANDGQGITFRQAAENLNRKLDSFNMGQYRNAASRGMHIKEQGALAVVKREFPAELTIKNNDQEHVEKVLNFATDETRLKSEQGSGSLVAAGGWCAPSEITYDLLELESRDGLLSIPEVNIVRGGVQIPISPSFADIFSNIEGFSFTEEQDEAGEYDDGEVGDKPCYHIDCPDWEDHRLGVSGLCITAGLLQRRGFPEYQERVIRGALVAHDHRLNGEMIAQMEAGSTGVVMPSQQAGTTAPVLTSIELQVEHYRYTHRLGRGVTLEAVFPFWVRGAIRADLARRGAKDLLAVTDAEIQAWFTLRGVAPQFVYNWQGIEGTAAGSLTEFPGTVKFLLYTAGTWFRGASDIITIDTLYDSTLLAQNDYTALFTEEGWFVAKRGIDSRVVTVSIEANGSTHAGVAIEHNGVGGPIVVEDTGANNPELVLPDSGE